MINYSCNFLGNFFMVKLDMEFFLFTADLPYALAAEKAGIDSVIVDWEYEGKQDRQSEHDLEINRNSPDDIANLAANLRIPITVRVNAFSDATCLEIECAITHGANIIMLPMARSAAEVKNFLRYINNRTKTIIQIETLDLVNNITAFAKLNWNYAYIGLNDLMIEKKEKCIWSSVQDGTVELICKELSGKKYGFGGVTILGGGSPVNTELLLHEYVRLGSRMGILRRTFFREIQGRNIETEIPLVREFLRNSQQRGQEAIIIDKKKLSNKLEYVINACSGETIQEDYSDR